VSISDDWEKRRVGALEGLGEIERRTFVKLSGLSAAALIFGVGPFTEERRDLLREEINKMTEALTHPAYVDAMKNVRNAPRDERLVVGSRLLNPDALRAQGVLLPENMRISSRYFDEDNPQGAEFGTPRGLDSKATRFIPTAGCCCGGGASVCGGCGGGEEF
jgi:hypothetical protein